MPEWITCYTSVWDDKEKNNAVVPLLDYALLRNRESSIYLQINTTLLPPSCLGARVGGLA